MRVLEGLLGLWVAEKHREHSEQMGQVRGERTEIRSFWLMIVQESQHLADTKVRCSCDEERGVGSESHDSAGSTRPQGLIQQDKRLSRIFKIDTKVKLKIV